MCPIDPYGALSHLQLPEGLGHLGLECGRSGDKDDVDAGRLDAFGDLLESADPLAPNAVHRTGRLRKNEMVRVKMIRLGTGPVVVAGWK